MGPFLTEERRGYASPQPLSGPPAQEGRRPADQERAAFRRQDGCPSGVAAGDQARWERKAPTGDDAPSLVSLSKGGSCCYFP